VQALPFLEFDLARQLMLKLKILGRNAAFSCKLSLKRIRESFYCAVFLIDLLYTALHSKE